MQTTNEQIDDTYEGWELHDLIAVPIRTLEQIEVERRERAMAELRAREEQAFAAQGSLNAPTDSKFRVDAIDEWSDPLADFDGPKHRVLDRDEVERYMAASGSQSRDSSTKSRQRELYKLIKTKGEFRKLAEVPSDWPEKLAEMEIAFPNFGEVIDYLGALFALAGPEGRVPCLDPMVLLGPPGIGKSLFAEHLAQFLGSGVRRVNMENAQTGSSLSGSEEYWGNTRYGMVFEALVEGDYGNPVIFVDEVDKASTDSRTNPLAPLYVLLEPGTAASFRDLSVPRISLDASRITWVMTANDLSSVPDPICDRVKVFNVPPFSDVEARRIAQRVFDSLQTGMQLEHPFTPLSDEILNALVGMSARRQRQLLREACGRALKEARTTLRASDIRLPVTGRDIARKIGFL